MEAIKNIGKINAQLLADYVLQHYGPMSHLKLQKLLYYCEAYHLAYFEKPLLIEEFEAWVHGPVCREVYQSLKGESVLYSDLGYTGNSNTQELLNQRISTEQQELITDIIEELKSWTGLELENATHNELPWVEARIGYSPSEKCNVIIKKQTMLSFYKTEMNG